MIKLYENVVIGNFLYGLGYAIRAKIPTGVVPSMVNLLQQTPVDKLLGDVLLEFPGVVRLVEFKSRANQSTKEWRRHAVLKEALSDQFLAISRAVHWFIETHPESGSFISRIAPYLDAFPRPSEVIDDRLDKFLEATADAVACGEKGFSQDDYRIYLSLVARCNGPGEVGTGGILIAASGDGGLRFAGLTDLMQLRLQQSEFVLELEKEVQQSIRRERHLEQKLDIDFSLEP